MRSRTTWLTSRPRCSATAWCSATTGSRPASRRRSSWDACSSATRRPGSAWATGVPPDRSMSGMSELLRRLSWPALRRLGIHLGGAEQSLVRGPGIEYSDAREYTPGDDSRLIDWNLTARSDRPFVKDSFPERALDAWLVLDVSPSMAWGTARCLKGRLVTETAVAASELLSRSGNRVGVVLFGGGPPRIVPPRAGRAHRLRMLASLEEATATAAAGPTDLTSALET